MAMVLHRHLRPLLLTSAKGVAMRPASSGETGPIDAPCIACVMCRALRPSARTKILVRSERMQLAFFMQRCSGGTAINTTASCRLERKQNIIEV